MPASTVACLQPSHVMLSGGAQHAEGQARWAQQPRSCSASLPANTWAAAGCSHASLPVTAQPASPASQPPSASCPAPCPPAPALPSQKVVFFFHTHSCQHGRQACCTRRLLPAQSDREAAAAMSPQAKSPPACFLLTACQMRRRQTKATKACLPFSLLCHGLSVKSLPQGRFRCFLPSARQSRADLIGECRPFPGTSFFLSRASSQSASQGHGQGHTSQGMLLSHAMSLSLIDKEASRPCLCLSASTSCHLSSCCHCLKLPRHEAAASKAKARPRLADDCLMPAAAAFFLLSACLFCAPLLFCCRLTTQHTLLAAARPACLPVRCLLR